MSYSSAQSLHFTLLSLSFLLCITTFANNTELIKPKKKTSYNMAPTYNFTPEITSTMHPNINVEMHPNIVVSNSSTLSVKITEFSMQCIQQIKDTVTRDNCNLLAQLITKKLWEYRYMIACGTLLGSYSIISLLLCADYYHYLQGDALWARWKPEYDFETLCIMPQKELTQKLLADINERNYNKNNPTDFAHPLTLFISSIDGEIKTCKRYLAIAQTIQRLHLMPIFPTNDAKIDAINKLLQRALFIKHLFLSWLSDYNIASNKK